VTPAPVYNRKVFKKALQGRDMKENP
jgi:hypothetical protein